jgi:hypothetical protein
LEKYKKCSPAPVRFYFADDEGVMENTNIKIYDMNDCDWCAAENAEGALIALAMQFGYSDVEKYVEDYPDARETIRELSDEQMNRLILTYEDDNFEPQEQTFAAGLQRMISEGKKFPAFFASTEY